MELAPTLSSSSRLIYHSSSIRTAVFAGVLFREDAVDDDQRSFHLAADGKSKRHPKVEWALTASESICLQRINGWLRPELFLNGHSVEKQFRLFAVRIFLTLKIVTLLCTARQLVEQNFVDKLFRTTLLSTQK